MSLPGNDLPRHPMRVVIRRTGLTPDLLRAWERRYGVVAPRRSEGGQRLYSDGDIERLALLHRATSLGRNIGQIASLDPVALSQLIREDEALPLVPPAQAPAGPAFTPGATEFLQGALRAVELFDTGRLEAVLRQAALTLPVAALTDQVVAPLLLEVGSRWHQGLMRPAQEHLASAAARRILSWVASQAPVTPDAPGIVVTTPAGQVHEIGALLAATTAATAGWRVTYLGADLPAEDIAASVRQTRSVLLALSIVFPLDDPGVHDQLRRLHGLLDPAVAVVAGGAGAASYQATLDKLGIRLMGDLAAFREVLLHAPRSAGVA